MWLLWKKVSDSQYSSSCQLFSWKVPLECKIRIEPQAFDEDVVLIMRPLQIMYWHTWDRSIMHTTQRPLLWVLQRKRIYARVSKKMATGPLRWVDIVEGMGTVVGAMGTVGVIASEENEVGSIETGRYRRGHSGYCGYTCVWRRWSWEHWDWSISWTVSPQQRTEILDSTPVFLCKYGWYGWQIQLVIIRHGIKIQNILWCW